MRICSDSQTQTPTPDITFDAILYCIHVLQFQMAKTYGKLKFWAFNIVLHEMTDIMAKHEAQQIRRSIESKLCTPCYAKYEN